jgi:basic membrane protein A
LRQAISICQSQVRAAPGDPIITRSGAQAYRLSVVIASRSRSWGRLVLTLAVAPALLVASTPAADGATPPRVVLLTHNCAENFLCPAFEKALRETGLSGRIISPNPREDPVGTLSLLAAQGYDPVIVDLDHTDGLAAAAARFPGTHFVVFDRALSALHIRRRNVQALVVEPREAAYLAGWLAARLEMRRPGPDVIGAVGGFRIPVVDGFISGFTAGARDADPTITVLTGYSNDFVDGNKCEAIARTQIARGAGVVFNVAGLCGLGTLAAAKEAGVWGIGVDADQSFLGSFILTSVIKRYDNAILTLVTAVASGDLRTSGRTTYVGMRDGGAVLGRISPKVPAPIRIGLVRVRRQILDGRLRVPEAPAR